MGLEATRPACSLVVEGITLRFGGVTALNEVTIEVRTNEVLAIIGPNGAGKSSLFNVITGLYRPQRGRVAVIDDAGGETEIVGPDSTSRAAELGIARTFQNIELAPDLTVLENVLVGRHRLMRSGVLSHLAQSPSARREERDHRVAATGILADMGLSPFAQAMPGLLPYGIRKRVELARAVAAEPTILLLDEPVAGMGAEESAQIAHEIRKVQRSGRSAQIVVEHDMDVVMAIADRVVVIDFGRVLATGTPKEVQNNPAVIDAYLGAEL